MSNKNKIIAFEWNHAKYDEQNSSGNSLVIGQFLPNWKSSVFDSIDQIPIYGVALDIPDEGKDFRLTKLSCHRTHLVGEIKEVSKDEARNLFHEQIEKILEIMFDETEQNSVKEHLDKPEELEGFESEHDDEYIINPED